MYNIENLLNKVYIGFTMILNFFKTLIEVPKNEFVDEMESGFAFQQALFAI